MREIIGLDDARKIRVMAWATAAAGPLMILSAGMGLAMAHARFGGSGDAAAKAADWGSGSSFAILLVWMAFYATVTGARTRGTFLRLTGLCVLGIALALAARVGLLAATGHPVDRAVGDAEVAAVMTPLVVLFGTWRFRRTRSISA